MPAQKIRATTTIYAPINEYDNVKVNQIQETLNLRGKNLFGRMNFKKKVL